MWIVWDPSYEVNIGPHVFPTRKYRLVRERLLAERVVPAEAFRRPSTVTDADVQLVHTAAYVAKLRDDALSVEERLVLEVPFTPALRRAMWLCAGGTLLTAQRALEDGVGVHLGGGFHHAFPDHGEGFCLINDVAIAVRMLQRDGAIARALIVDLDVHHGNGTAAIFAHDPRVFTFSMHQEHNYPFEKPAGDLDVGLEDATDDAEYLEVLGRLLPRVIRAHKPDVLCYLAGADPYADDQLGGLALTVKGLAARDDLVLASARAAGVPVAVTLAGGYARDEPDTVAIHCNTVRAALRAAGA